LIKKSRIFRTLTFIVILCLLLLTIPATPVVAQSIFANPSSGLAGTSVTLTGLLFNNYALQFVHILFDRAWVAWAEVTVDGSFVASFDVPTDATEGVYFITVQHATPTYNPSSQIWGPVIFTVTVPPPPQEREITVSPLSGNVGSAVTVSGSDFNPSSNVAIHFDSTVIHSVTTDATGTFSGATFTVPESYGGIHTIKGSDANGEAPTVDFTTLQTTKVTPTSGTVGDAISISGNGFGAHSSINIYFDAILINTGATTADVNGSFTNNLLSIPLSSRGNHTLKVQDDSGNFTNSTLETREKMSFTPIEGISGTVVTVSGSGFRGSVAMTVKYDGVPVITSPTPASTDVNGSFTLSFNVPAGATGPHLVEVTDGTYSVNSNFTAIAVAEISQVTSEGTPGYVSMELTLTGNGFKPNVPVTITLTSDPIVLSTVTTDAAGTFSAKVTIPQIIGGNHIITVTDGTTTKEFAFVMESQAPPELVLLLPEDGVNVEVLTAFDWTNVEDISGVTYSLEIASDANFNTMVLEKTGLTLSGYTITEKEQLEPVSEDEPYYWRVKAIDGASNESQSEIRSFYSGFQWPDFIGWPLYLIIGFGGVLLLFFGFWLGRRTAYY
jgi:hypothetical protein